MVVRVRYVCYPVTTLGPGERLGIWVSGCSRSCPGCMSPELRESVATDEVPVDELLGAVRSRRDRYDGVTISGGEPFDQAAELAELVRGLRELTDHVLVYTGYRREELEADASRAAALEGVDVLIDGPYERGLDDGRGIRGSANQRVWRLSANAGDFDYEGAERATQSFVFDDVVFMAGLT